VRSPDKVMAIISNGNQSVHTALVADSICMHATQAASSTRVCYKGLIIRDQSPVLHYSGLFSTAMDGTAVGGASDRIT